jgi:hypothetical protein
MTNNVYSKLQAARVKLQKMNLKKTGKNTFAKYDYFELGDFLPAINEIFDEMKLFSLVTFTTETATLTIINAEKPDETIQFTSPMATAELKGVHAIQNAGAVMTYQRRYLYVTALEITESDMLDATTGNSDQKQRIAPQNASQQNGTKASDNQVKMINAKLGNIARRMGTTKEDILVRWNIKEVGELSKQQASAMIDRLAEMEQS